MNGLTRVRHVLGLSVLAILVSLVVSVLPVAAKSFVFSRVAIEATVGRDGGLSIVESRTYRFDGPFSWATYRLPLRGTSGIRRIRVADERGPYAPASSAAPGTYQVRREGDEAVIRWNFSAADESRTFVLSYVLDDVVTAYADVAELYWKFIGTGWDRPTEDVRITIRLPDNVPVGQIRVWGHGPLHGQAHPMAGGASLTIRDLPASTMVEGRIVFPTHVVAATRKQRAETALPRILKEEGAWAAQANRSRMLRRALPSAMLAVPVLLIAFWIYLYMRFGREPVPAPPEGYYRELPAPYSPAELGALWRFGSVQPADFVATILDLVRRGYLTVKTHAERGFLRGRDVYTLTRTDKAKGLAPHETEALTILFGSAAAEGQPVTIDPYKGLPEGAKKRMRARFPTWTRLVSQAANARGFFDSGSMTMRWVALAAGVFAIVAGWMAFVSFMAWQASPGAVGGVATIVSGVVVLAGSGAVRRRSQRGADDLRQWQGFRRFLLDFSEMREAELPALTMWEHYLVYAVPLGVADRVIAQLKKIYPAEELARSPGLQAWTSSSRASPLASFSSFTNAFASATSSVTSSTGSGGGFSRGGGGGGGGSGGSAG